MDGTSQIALKSDVVSPRTRRAKMRAVMNEFVKTFMAAVVTVCMFEAGHVRSNFLLLSD